MRFLLFASVQKVSDISTDEAESEDGEDDEANNSSSDDEDSSINNEELTPNEALD